MKLLSSVCLCLAVLSAVSAEAPQWRWHEKTAQPHTTRFFRIPFELKEKAKSAPVTFGLDDIGSIYVNGRRIASNIHMPPKTWHLENYLKPGKNVIAVQVLNHIGIAGLIVSGDILLESGNVQKLSSGGTVLSGTKADAGWTDVKFDDSGWKTAEVLGGPDELAPWNRKGSVMDPFRAPDAARGTSRLLLDDFADISSWLGGGQKHTLPGADTPSHFSLGSVPDPRRDDGWAGELRFAFAKPGGEAAFHKNRLYQMRRTPRAILFSADTRGHGGSLRFRFFDKFNRRHLTKPVPLSPTVGWRDYRVELDETTFPGYSKLAFPLALDHLIYTADKAGTGHILIDDLFYIGHASSPGQQLAIHPDYHTLAVPPGTAAEMTFRFRNALNRKIRAKLLLQVLDSREKELFRQTAELELGPCAFLRRKFTLGTFRDKGVYSVRLTADIGTGKQTYLGWLGVFTPNGKRLNKYPMWFGIEDQEINTAPYEATLHASWMKLLGIDLIRAGFHGSRAERVRGSRTGYDGFREMWKPHVATGAALLLDFAGGMPPWTRPDADTPKGTVLPLNCDPARFREHFEHLADFIASMPSIQYFEWINEPNLSRFYRTGMYCEALRQLYPILKAKNPALKVGTGGLVVNHPSVTPGFAEQVYGDMKDYYDIAFYHAHSGYRRYIIDTNAAFSLLPGTGKRKPLANTEAGYRSYQGMPHLFYNQARELVKKITVSKAMNLEFYIWFMLQDYWDKYRNADDSFGLVTVDNQPKPSFAAYNELIRQLSNTTPAGASGLHPELEGWRFLSDKEEVHVLWPKQDGTVHTLCLETEQNVLLTDLFGNEQRFRPVDGIAALPTPELPFYLRMPKDSVRPAGALLTFAERPVRLPGSDSPLNGELHNPFRKTVRCTLTDDTGKRHTATLAGKSSARITLPCALPAGTAPGPVVRHVEIVMTRPDGKTVYSGGFRFPVSSALPITETAGPAITLDSEKQLMELAFDPTTPRWGGKTDLSARVRLRRDAQNLIFNAEISDNDHSVPHRNESIWKNDSIQIAIADDRGRLTEFTVSGQTGAPAVAWRHIAPDESRTGRFRIPLSVNRSGGVTRYRFSVPFSELGISPAKGTRFRLAFLINDNDAGKRLRIMEYFKGIEGTKNPELFGWCILD